MRIAIVTDAWHPQVNGVVRTYENTVATLRAAGHSVQIFSSSAFTNVPCPTYPSIRIAVWPGAKLQRMLDAFDPQAIHIATEGPCGLAARHYCLRQRRAFTTSFHTQFPEYIRARVPVPIDWSYAWLRRFHRPARCTLVPTPSQRDRLQARGFSGLTLWPRGVDTRVFNPDTRAPLQGPRPISMYMGRVAVEKNIEAFLRLDLPGTQYVIGSGPDMDRLRKQFPNARFLGEKRGAELAAHVAAADVFVFPSRTDTFGVVLLEAMACGVPVAAFPVTGPLDVVEHGRTGYLDDDLERAIHNALKIDPQTCIDQARVHSWQRATDIFLHNLVDARPQRVMAA
ncbi:MAG: glycosyltransferase family 1 protein [Gammaproteobacteria bacterium]|nr:glycosyltransferase family 1 protein [Gammaproteobacteria bacterium]